ncbi:hypothetical protein CR513_59961, partial [Mucuna pruriens]
MARLNPVLLITLLVLVSYSSVLDARKILKIETQQMLSLKGTPPSSEANSYVMRGNGRLVAHLANEKVVSNPSPGHGSVISSLLLNEGMLFCTGILVRKKFVWIERSSHLAFYVA